MGKINKTSIIEDGAKLGSNVAIGPWCYIGENVSISDNVQVVSNATIVGETIVGDGTIISSNVVLGGAPQDPKYSGGGSFLIVGSNNKIHEFVTIHGGDKKINEKTLIGNNNIVMAYTHIGHGVTLGCNNKIASFVAIAGGVDICDNVVIGGQSAVSQKTRVGSYCYLTARSGVSEDVPPFVIVSNIDGSTKIRGINRIGMERGGMFMNDILCVRDIVDIWCDERINSRESIEKIGLINNRYAKYFIEFVESTKKGVVRNCCEKMKLKLRSKNENV